jgi:hypothetical protein
MMMNEFYEKTPSLSLRLRVARVAQVQKLNSNNLECHSSSFELIRVRAIEAALEHRMNSNRLEYARIISNAKVTNNG